MALEGEKYEAAVWTDLLREPWSWIAESCLLTVSSRGEDSKLGSSPLVRTLIPSRRPILMAS